MDVRVIIFVCGLALLAGSVRSAVAETPGSRRQIAYDSEWILHDFDPGFDVQLEAEQEERQRWRLRDDGTGALRDGRRSDAPTFAPQSLPIFPSLNAPPSVPERRQRNWILPTLEDDAGALWSDPEEREESGWGWLADELEQRRLLAAEEQSRRMEQEEQSAEEESWRRTLGDREDENRLPQRGVLTFDREPADNGEVHDRNVARLASMSPDELQDWVAQQDAMGMDDPFDRADPWDSERANASPWAFTGEDSELHRSGLFAATDSRDRWGSGFQGVDWSGGGALERARDQGGNSAGTSGSWIAAGRDSRGGQFESRFGGTAEPGGMNRRDGNLGSTGFAPVENVDGGWAANWSGGSDWQPNSVQGGTSLGSAFVSEPTPIQRPTTSAFPMHNDGRLAAP